MFAIVVYDGNVNSLCHVYCLAIDLPVPNKNMLYICGDHQ